MEGYRVRPLAALLLGVLGIACQPASPPLSPPSPPTASDTLGWQTHLTASLKAFERGDTLEAFTAIEKALQVDSTQPFLHEVKGYLFYTQGQDSAALRCYERALALGGASAQLHHRMASAYMTQRRWQEAYYHLQKALSTDSANPELWTTLGLWAYLQKKLPEAARYWQTALQKDSLHDKARTFLYELYLNDLGQPDTAKSRYLDPYWRVDRFNPLLNFQLGNYYLKKMEAAERRREPQKALAAYAFQAAQAYTQAITGHPSYAQAYYNRGLVFFKVEKYDRALDDFAKAAELNPRDARAHFMTGSLHELKRNTAQACEAYKRALQVQPDFPEARQAVRELACP
jgi:tetratricopeptide (TPR) repeat protein